MVMPPVCAVKSELTYSDPEKNISGRWNLKEWF